MTILTDKKVTWREYQKQLIAQLPKYKSNHSIHFVAPPGSGKTYLGIEIIRQLDKKTLILVPSLVLKQQWIDTIQTIFLKNASDQAAISDSIEIVKEITIETYQTIYSRLTNDPEFLAREKIDVLVLDEAHHLKKSWGETLLNLKAAVPRLLTVSLTATPPYDATLQEWTQYQLLNGPIDEEISIPSLIKEDVLAPHQDYLYLVSAPIGIVDQYETFIQKQAEVVENIAASTEIADYLLQQPFIQHPKAQEEFIYQAFDIYLSSLLFLQLHGYQLEEEHWLLLGVTKSQGEKGQFPTFDKQHMIDLLVYLYESAPELCIFDYLEKEGWVSQKQLQLFPDFSESLLSQAPIEKKEAICRILLCEYEKLGSELSGLVLTNFIKKDVLLGKNGELEYGLVPIFDSLVPFFKEELGVAAVCGEFLIIPKKLAADFFEVSIKSSIHPYFEEYCVVYPHEQKRSTALSILTRLISEKVIQLLIGTSSLLGEGWDCPEINTVVLANQSVSFVQTQQLRGRGLRIDGSNKTTNIWHLAVVIPELEYAKQIDVGRIMKRMGYVCGLTFETQPSIESGIERFNLLGLCSGKEIAVYNQEMLFWSGERKQLAHLWKYALEKGSRLTMPLIVRKDPQLGHRETKPFVVMQSVTENIGQKSRYHWIGITALSVVGALSQIVNPLMGSLILGLDGVAIVCVINKEKISKTFLAYNKKKIWKKEMMNIRYLALSVIETFINLGLTEADALSRLIIEEADQECRYFIDQAKYQEEHLFHTVMKEVLSEVKNPRYFLYTKTSKIIGVPELFARNKKSAELFQKAINQNFSIKSELIYSRNVEGRKKLVQAKMSKTNLVQDFSKNESIQKSIWV